MCGKNWVADDRTICIMTGDKCLHIKNVSYIIVMYSISVTCNS